MDGRRCPRCFWWMESFYKTPNAKFQAPEKHQGPRLDRDDISVKRNGSCPNPARIWSGVILCRFLRTRAWTHLASALAESTEKADEGVGEEGGDGDGQNPGPNHAFDDRPFNGAEAAGGADAHDGSGDVVGGGDGDAEVGGGEDDGGGAGLGGKAVDRMELHHFVAEGPDNAPTADRRAGAHGERANDFDPEGDAFLGGINGCAEEGEPGRRVVEVAGLGGREEGEGDDAHG